MIRMKKKWYQYIGNIFMIFALLFLFRKIITYQIDYTLLTKTSNVVCLFGCSLLYGIHIFLLCIAWRILLNIVTEKKIPYVIACNVWSKSNLLKYIPGNIFQYVGRNSIAPVLNLNHSDVALATALEILINVFSVFLIGTLCYSSGLKLWYQEYWATIKQWLLIVFALVLIILFFGVFFFKNRLLVFYTKVKKLFNIKNIIKEIGCILFFCFWAIYTSFLYIIILHQILGLRLNLQDIRVISGAFLLSWLIGFLMPGSPGGIGVRETVLTLILGNQFPVKEILLGIVLYRIINVFGDCFGLLFAIIYKKSKKRKEHEKFT